MLLLCIFIMLVEFNLRISCKYICTMKSFEVTCSQITEQELSNDVSVTLNKSDIVSLNLTNSAIRSISANTLKDFSNLQSLYVTNSEVSNLEDNTFANSSNLIDLYLSQNNLTQFNLRAFTPVNGLTVLDLSNNIISEFSNFNISYFPKLTLLNIANNMLSYLPENLIEKLKEQNEFYIVSDNNPWNCNHSNWSKLLNEKLVDAFCTNKTFNYVPKVKQKQEVQLEFTSKKTILNTSENTNRYNEEDSFGKTIFKTDIIENQEEPFSTLEKKTYFRSKPVNCWVCSWNFCLFWFGVGVWVGIIVGNICKLRKIFCHQPKQFSDQGAQCDLALVETRQGTGYYHEIIRPYPNLSDRVGNKSTEENKKANQENPQISTQYSESIQLMKFKEKFK